MKLFSAIKQVIQPNKKFSSNWLRTCSDKELEDEREPIRMKAMYEWDTPDGTKAERILEKIDREMNRRSTIRYNSEKHSGTPVHHEHGWHLPEDDD